MADAVAAVAEIGSGRDVELVGLAQRGNADAFDVLVAPRVERLVRTAMAILGHEAEARDATQDALVAAWRDLPALRDASRFDAWLMRILVNACRRSLRTSRRMRVREIRIDWAADGRLATNRDDPAARADADAIARAFDRLSVDHRAIVVLHALEGHTLDEIASVLGIPLGTAKSRHHFARRALAAALEAELR